jgi:hypothetical protein
LTLFIKINFLYNKLIARIDTYMKLIKQNQMKKISRNVALIINKIQK